MQVTRAGQGLTGWSGGSKMASHAGQVAAGAVAGPSPRGLRHGGLKGQISSAYQAGRRGYKATKSLHLGSWGLHSGTRSVEQN